jgi:hypothetical protein
MKTVGPPYSGKLNVRWDGKGMVTDQDRASEALHMGKPAETDRPGLPSLSHSFTLDFVILMRARVGETLKKVKEVLGRMELTLNEEKSRVVDAREGGFNFLDLPFAARETDRRGRILSWWSHRANPNCIFEKKCGI